MAARSRDSANRSAQRRRNAVAVAVSTMLHVLFLGYIVTRAPPPPPEPEIIVQPLDVTVMPMPPIPEKPEIIIPPKMTPHKIEVVPEVKLIPVPVPPPPQPQPPKPEPPKPEPSKPAPPSPVKPTPAKPTPPTPPTPAPPKPVTPIVSPLPAPVAPAVRPSPAPPAPQPAPKPPSPQPSPSPAPVVTLNNLNLHKPEKKAPVSVPVLPVAPKGGAVGGASAAADLAGAAFAAPGSRLSGLNPYPYGAMPSGGSGLRGTLVGCANASAVGLSSVERAHCAERFGVRADRAPALDGISPSKRAGFDAAADRQERDRSNRGVDPMSAMRGGQAPSPSEPDIKNSPTSFQH